MATKQDILDIISRLPDSVNSFGALNNDEFFRQMVAFIDTKSDSIPQIIDMLPGQYLSDILETITDASVDKPYTINFYNHSKTIDWSKFTQKIVWPRFVNLNFVGSINWWPFKYYPGMGYDEDLTSDNPTDKLFLGFDFNQQNEDGYIHQCGLPNLLNKIFFGGLDQAYQIVDDYVTLYDNKDDYANDYLHLVWAGGDSETDARNSKLYIKLSDPAGTLVDVTPDFRMVDFSGCQFMGAYMFGSNIENANLQSANLQSANLGYANLANAYLENISVNYSSNFQNANLNGATNLPESLNTKAKFIAAVGAGNVNAGTIWVDGTSILAE